MRDLCGDTALIIEAEARDSAIAHVTKPHPPAWDKKKKSQETSTQFTLCLTYLIDKLCSLNTQTPTLTSLFEHPSLFQSCISPEPLFPAAVQLSVVVSPRLKDDHTPLANVRLSPALNFPHLSYISRKFSSRLSLAGASMWLDKAVLCFLSLRTLCPFFLSLSHSQTSFYIILCSKYHIFV